ncbi:branched-chain amino acid ABC transporter permease [Thetidibacter halocola]|uniref:Branched-chain amino acid ABC transporter permease n=1 Tax=Thetidibacter halocola TaxID=2827239 RepID=A0A8J7WBG6_9RHOB|nr:branched-chain amino acid ABC transporter permease [Thetidibacter halocola]MBS0124462.1 branched-chain amino acid ABC transporter permease [Thetidibacter halocola]
MIVLDTILQGVLLGGLYALFATGLSLIFGVMRLVNLAHGDFMVVGAFAVLIGVDALGLPILLAAVVAGVVMFGLGYLLQSLLLNRTLGKDILPPLLVTFGLSIILQNGMLEAFSADTQRLDFGALSSASVPLGGGLAVGVIPLMTFASAVLVILFLNWLFYRTELGRAFRATSDKPEIAQLMGIDNNRIFALAMALALVVVAIAGLYLGARATFDPLIGPSRLIFAFEAVIIGGLGSFWGTLAGGVILGLAQTVGAQISPEWQTLAGHVVFLVVLVLRPRGLFPRHVD